MPSDKNDCLNQILINNNACPCPPHIVFVENDLVIQDTPIGKIKLESC